MAISIAEIQAHPTEAMAALIETVNRLGEEIAIMKRDSRLYREDIRDLFEAIDSLEQTKVQPAQKDRKEVLKALLLMNQGKMLARDARHKMNLSESQFSQIIAKAKDEIEVRPLNSNKRMNLLVLRSAKG